MAEREFHLRIDEEERLGDVVQAKSEAKRS